MKKRSIDILFSLLGLVVFSPFILITACLIKLTTRGSIFRTEKVHGKSFKLFQLYSFNIGSNSASHGGDSQSTNEESPSEESRSLGGADGVFRRLRLDRLPQLINVLTGEMSFIGPRPETQDFVSLFQKEYELILRMRPGMIDLSSITLDDQPLSPLDPPERVVLSRSPSQKIKLAKEYVLNQTLALDMKIFMASVVNLLLSSPFPFYKKRQGRGKSIQEVMIKYRARTIFCLHTMAVVGSSYLAFLLRFDADVPETAFDLFLGTLPFLVVCRLAVLHLFGLQATLWRYVGIMDVVSMGVATAVSSGVFWSTMRMVSSRYPQSILVIDSVLFFLILATLRCTKRVYKNLTHMSMGARKVFIIGAGNAGAMIARDLLQNPSYNRQPVAFIDDDLAKQNVKIHGIPVIGTCSGLHAAVSKIAPEEIIIALPSATPLQIKPILNQCKPLGLPIKHVPNLPALLNGTVSISDLRSLDIEDLIGRPEITIEKEEVQEKVRGKRVLVTGAGGSIGSELSRQIAAFEPALLILFEQNENNLHHILLDIQSKFPAVSAVGILADILHDKKREQVFQQHKPQMVFHAAAYKHVPLMEANPSDAARNNVIGTARLLLSSVQHNAEEFVLISTDKAVYPSGIMGATKRIAEMVVQYYAPKVSTRLLTVRFGNVLESSGSVVPLFRNQIRRGGPVTVTHPEVKRYFITIHEAVQLVLQAAVMGEGGEVFVLDMGEPYKILDLAKTMITLSGYTPDRDIPIQFVGLRPGEKLVEELFEEGEAIKNTSHPKISIAKNGKVAYDIPPYLERLVQAIEDNPPPAQIRAILRELLPTCTNL